MFEKSIVLSFILAVNLVAAQQWDYDSEITKALTDFGNKLFVQAVKTNPGNVAILPHSVVIVLAILYFAAGGQTLDEIKHALGLKDQDTNAEYFKDRFPWIIGTYGVKMDLVNIIYLRNTCSLHPSFEHVVKHIFQSEVMELNFSGEDPAISMSACVNKITRGYINDAVRASSIGENTGMVLIHALYFHGTWRHIFDEEQNSTEKFFINENKSEDITFMHQVNRFDFAKGSHARAVRMKFRTSNMYFVIILPKKQNGLPFLRDQIENLDLINSLNFESKLVKLAVPKFEITYSVDMNKVLKEMGLTKIFDKPDFDSLFKSCEHRDVAAVLHETKINFHETGCGARYAYGIDPENYDSYDHEFKASHPFFFCITEHDPDDKTKYRIIFSGQYLGENLANNNDTPMHHKSNTGTIHQRPQAEVKNQKIDGGPRFIIL